MGEYERLWSARDPSADVHVRVRLHEGQRYRIVVAQAFYDAEFNRRNLPATGHVEVADRAQVQGTGTELRELAAALVEAAERTEQAQAAYDAEHTEAPEAGQ